MGIEENKETVRRYIKEILNNLDYAHAKELMHEDFFGQGGTITSVEEHEKFFKAQRQRIPDGINTLQEMIAEGDKVIAISMLTYTDTAGVAGHPPTNKPVNQKVIVVYTLKDGRIVKGEPLSDAIGAARSVGHTTINLS